MRASSVLRATIFAFAVGVASACHRNRAAARPEPSVALVVRNDGVFDVTIYALPSGTTASRIRVGQVSGVSTTTLAVPKHGLQSGGSLTLMLHAIGAGSSWVSPTITLPEGTRAYLDIYASPSGDLSRSTFYVLTTASREESAPFTRLP